MKYLLTFVMVCMLSGVAVNSTIHSNRHQFQAQRPEQSDPSDGGGSWWDEAGGFLDWLVEAASWPGRAAAGGGNNDGCSTQSCNHTPGSN